MRLRSMIVTSLAAIALVLGVAGPAQAAPGTVRGCNVSTSIGYVTFDIYPGGSYSAAKGQCVGEGTSTHPDVEVRAVWVPASYCVEWWINAGSHTTTRGGAYGLWQNLYPGDGYSGTWTAYTRRYDC